MILRNGRIHNTYQTHFTQIYSTSKVIYANIVYSNKVEQKKEIVFIL